MKEFEREKIKAVKLHNDNFECVMELNSYLNEDFCWWKNNILKMNKY